jgi:D-alanyl-D-alanine carboxypeptidase
VFVGRLAAQVALFICYNFLMSSRFKFLNETRDKVYVGVIVALFLTSSYLLYANFEYKKQNDQFIADRDTLKFNLDELNAKYLDMAKQVEMNEADKMMLIQSFNQVGSQYNSLMQDYTVKTSEVDKLSKVVLIDDELLKKYSKYYFLNENYSPASTTLIDFNLTLNNKNVPILTEIKPKLENMINTAKLDGVTLVVHSGYRSFKEQMGLKSAYTQKFGLSKSNQFSADQGYSEHQLGTTVDISDGKSGLSTSFEKTTSFTWLQNNAHKYGFILSYPKNNSYYIYEPWHYRYVGVELATYLKTNNLNFYDLDQNVIDTYKIKIFE